MITYSGIYEVFQRIRLGFSLPDNWKELAEEFIRRMAGTPEGEAAEALLEYSENKEKDLERKFLSIHQGIIEQTPEPKDILVLFAQKEKRNTAIEGIVKIFLQSNHCYTTMHDEKSEMWIYQEGIYIPHGRTKIRAFTREILGEQYTTQIVNQVIARIEADTFIQLKEFYDSEYEDIIPVENGLLYVRENRLEPFNPDKIFFSKLPIFYNKDKSCMECKKHFSETLKSPEDVEIMQEWFGTLLLKNYRYQKAIMMNGEGSNGKSITIELMKRFLGVDNCVSKTLQDLSDNEWAPGCLFKKLANLAGDMDRAAMKKTGIFKSITSGSDMISAKRKFLPDVEFVNHAKCVFSCNELPMTYDTSDAYMRRWLFFEFVYKFVSPETYEKLAAHEKTNVKIADNYIFEKLTTPDELSGLLNWAIEGLKRVETRGSIKDNHTTEEVKKIWVQKSNSFAAFFNEFCELDWDSYIVKQELHKEYIDFCRANNLKPATPKMIKIFLGDEGIDEEQKTLEENERKFVWRGLKLKPRNKGYKGNNPFFTYSKKYIFSLEGKTPLYPLYPLFTSELDKLKQLIDSHGKGPFHREFFTSSMSVKDEVIDDFVKKGLLLETSPNFYEGVV